MRRRKFLGILGSAVVAWPLTCVYRIFDSAWTQGTDGVSSRPDDRTAQIDFRHPSFALQVESKAGSGNPGAAAADQCAPATGAKKATPEPDRFLFVWLYRWFPSVLGAVAIVRPETIIRWHGTGFRVYWRWRSRNRIGRPKVSAELRTLIGEMSGANPLLGRPTHSW